MTEPTLRDQLQASLGTAYTIERELGGGGMSRVFLARDESLGRDVVIKVLPPGLAAGMSAERFTREIKLAARLQHPHVLPVLSAGVSNGLPYYMMPFVRGDSLRTAMGKGPLSMDDVLVVLRDVARALRYAHGEGVVHRDIKPENILLSSGSAVVADFGIAKAVSASRTEAPGGTLTQVGMSIGTPAYMSPEQAAADPNLDHRADIYSWGVVAYELLSGKHPFAGKTTPQQLLAAHLTESPEPLRKTAATVPSEVTDVVMRALEKDPDRRPQTADQVIVHLGGPSKVSFEAMPRATRPRWMVPAIAALAIVLLAGGAWIWKNRSASLARESSIMLAVLPFDNQGPAEQDYFVDGLTDAVNGKLAGLSGVSVIDRRSTMSYRKTTKPAKQIGSELGVEYVLEGVVRWARSPSGWRAQVMPTLVNTRDATTRWAGDPLVVSSDDPFSAQTEIATKVAGALQLALGAQERRDLAERPTESAEAYDAYMRGKAIFDATWRKSVSVRDLDQAISEFKRATDLDAKFAKAWAMLAQSRLSRSIQVPGDSMSARVAAVAAQKAAALDARDPLVVLATSSVEWEKGDRARAIKIISDAVNAGLTDSELIGTYAFDLYDVGKVDSANMVMARAVTINPRYAETRVAAADLAALQKDWAAVERHMRALISMDPTDERAWNELGQMARLRGDSAGIRKVLEEAFRYIPSPSNLLLVFMVYSGNELGSRFVRLTPEQLRIETLYDSVSTYYDNKADFFLRYGNLERARTYHDSIIVKVQGRNLSGSRGPRIMLYLANAYAQSGRIAEARRELERARNAARSLRQLYPDGSPELDRRIVAGVLGLTGQHAEGVRGLETLLRTTGWTRRGLALEPKLRAWRGNPLFEQFISKPE